MFSDRVFHLRRIHQMSQREFAEKLGVAKQTVSNWETGNAIPSLDRLRQIAVVYRVSTDYLLGLGDARPEGGEYLDVTGLTKEQIYCIQSLIYDLRN